MRKSLLAFALVAGFILQPVLWASAARRSQAAPRHPFTLSAGRFTSTRSGAAARKALLRARRKSVRLRPVAPAETALIDPVPHGRFPFPPPLRGSHDSLIRQNVRSQRDGLERIQDDAEILSLRRQGQLVAVPETAASTVDERLPANRRYCRAWTAQFLSDFSRVHYGRFHRPLQVNSAVRTVEYQRHLELVNGNAAPADGDDASPHLTGATIDIAKKGLSMAEICWMRAYLTPLQAAGKIDVEEEFYQACFHITVYRAYRREAAPVELAKSQGHRVRRGSAALLAAGVR